MGAEFFLDEIAQGLDRRVGQPGRLELGRFAENGRSTGYFSQGVRSPSRNFVDLAVGSYVPPSSVATDVSENDHHDISLLSTRVASRPGAVLCAQPVRGGRSCGFSRPEQPPVDHHSTV